MWYIKLQVPWTINKEKRWEISHLDKSHVTFVWWRLEREAAADSALLLQLPTSVHQTWTRPTSSWTLWRRSSRLRPTRPRWRHAWPSSTTRTKDRVWAGLRNNGVSTQGKNDRYLSILNIRCMSIMHSAIQSLVLTTRASTFTNTIFSPHSELMCF